MAASDELYSRIKTITSSIVVSMENRIDPQNGAFRIYSNLYSLLQNVASLDSIFDQHPAIKSLIDDLLLQVEADSEYQAKTGIDKKKRGWNILGDQLTLRLQPRFSKQNPHDPNRSKDDQIEEWLKSNDQLTDADSDLVMAGYLAIHLVR